MTRANIVASRIAAFTFAILAVAPTPAHAFPHFPGIHRHPVAAEAQDSRVSMNLYNSAATFRDVKVGEKTYTLLPHDSMAIKAPVGTLVYAETTAALHRKGDVLLTVAAGMQNRTIKLN